MTQPNQTPENNMNSKIPEIRKSRVVMNNSLFELTKRLVQQNVSALEIVQITGLSKSAV